MEKPIDTSKFDTLSDQVVDFYGKNTLELHDTVKRVMQYFEIDYKNKDNIKPFLKLAVLIKSKEL